MPKLFHSFRFCSSKAIGPSPRGASPRARSTRMSPATSALSEKSRKRPALISDPTSVPTSTSKRSLMTRLVPFSVNLQSLIVSGQSSTMAAYFGLCNFDAKKL